MGARKASDLVETTRQQPMKYTPVGAAGGPQRHTAGDARRWQPEGAGRGHVRQGAYMYLYLPTYTYTLYLIPCGPRFARSVAAAARRPPALAQAWAMRLASCQARRGSSTA